MVGVVSGAREPAVPYVISPRGMLQPQAMQRGRMRKAAAWTLLDARNLNRAALLHATSEQEADGPPRSRTWACRLRSCPTASIYRPRAARRAAIARGSAFPDEAFVVLFLGRMHRIKRLDLLADAFAAARASASGRCTLCSPARTSTAWFPIC